MKNSMTEKDHSSSSIEAAPPPEITLRPFDLSDIDDFMVWSSDDRVSYYNGYESFTNKSDLLEAIKRSVLPHPWFRAVCLAGRPVGFVSVSPGEGNDRCRGMIGYSLAWEHWGKGIMTAAVRMAVERVFDELEGLERVEAQVDVENSASQRVVEKAGFQKEAVLRKFLVLKGRTRDMVMYSFLSTDRSRTN